MKITVIRLKVSLINNNEMSTGAFSYSDDVEFLDSVEDVKCYRREFWRVLRIYTENGNILSDDEVLDQWVYKYSTDGPDNECICTHKIHENCYIQNILTDHNLILGNTCIKRWMPKVWKAYSDARKNHCERCGEIHRNRKDNLCSSCRVIVKNENEEKQAKEMDEAQEAYELRRRIHMDKIRINFETRRIEQNEEKERQLVTDRKKGRVMRREYLDKRVMSVSKYKGLQFETLYNSHFDYCEWVFNLDKPTGIMNDLIEYIDIRQDELR